MARTRSGIQVESGRPKVFPVPMKPVEKVQLQRMRRVADAMNIELDEMERYNVFAPELEARRFVDILVESEGNLLNATKKYLKLDNTRNTEYIFRRGVEICNTLRVQELLKQAMDKESVSVDMIISGILDIAKEAKRDGDRLRAYELLGKFKDLFGEKAVKNTVEYNLNISEDAARRILDRRVRYEIGAGGKFEGVSEGRDDGAVVDVEEVIDGLHDTDAGELRT